MFPIPAIKSRSSHLMWHLQDTSVPAHHASLRFRVGSAKRERSISNGHGYMGRSATTRRVDGVDAFPITFLGTAQFPRTFGGWLDGVPSAMGADRSRDPRQIVLSRPSHKRMLSLCLMTASQHGSAAQCFESLSQQVRCLHIPLM